MLHAWWTHWQCEINLVLDWRLNLTNTSLLPTVYVRYISRWNEWCAGTCKQLQKKFCVRRGLYLGTLSCGFARCCSLCVFGDLFCWLEIKCPKRAFFSSRAFGILASCTGITFKWVPVQSQPRALISRGQFPLLRYKGYQDRLPSPGSCLASQTRIWEKEKDSYYSARHTRSFISTRRLYFIYNT